jgi:predicted dehydrogenase
MPSLGRFRDLLLGGRIGRILSARAEVGQFLPSWRPGADYRQTVSARADLGGGVLLELSHEIDYLLWLFGEAAWVWAHLGRRSCLEIEVEDTANLALAFAEEPEGSRLVAALNMDFVRHDKTRNCTVIGADGSLRWDAIAGTVEVFEPGEDGWRSLFNQPPPIDESYRAEWRHFLYCIARGSEPLVGGGHGLAVLRVVEAARESARCGAKVVLHNAGSTGPGGGMMA